MKASKMKKVMAWILTVLMLFSMFGGTALAEENGEGGAEDSTAGYTPINTYVLTYEGEGAKPYLYGSRFEYKHSYNDPDAGENSVWTYWNCPEIFNLVNATDGSSIAAYCTDADTSTRSNATYQRMNLEDSTYHASGAADRLRAVLLNSFPKKSVEEVVTAVTQANLTVTNLQLGELISATQQAIWEISHGDKYTVDVRYTGIREESEYDKNEFVYPESLNATHTEYTGSNMETLYQYFINMAGVPATEQVLTSAAFADKNMYIVNHSDGTQQSVINAVINVQMKDGTDSLTVSAVVNGQVLASQALVNGENKVNLTLPGQADSVMLAIDGTQTVAGVYLFDALGERTESQSMVGYDDSSLPVHAETTVTPDNAISITKITTTTEKNAEDQEVTVEHPLEGIEFDIYYVCDVDTYNSEILKADGTLNTEVLDAKKTAVAVMTTDEDGKAFCDVTLACKTEGLSNADGVYQVVERTHPAIKTPAAPVLVFLPGTVEGSEAKVYTAELQLENEVKPAPYIDKDVQEIDNEKLSVNAGEDHTWIIRCEVPADMADAKKYEITDTLDYRLSYADELEVKVGEADDETEEEDLTLTIGEHYDLDVEEIDQDGHGVDKITISLTGAGMDAVAEFMANKGEACEVRVYFEAKIDANGEISEDIPNQAALEYTNSVGFAHDKVYSDEPAVYTCGLRIYKYDVTDTNIALEGAVFKIARVATQEEIEEGHSDPLVLSGGNTIQVYYESFYTVEDWTQEGVQKVDYVTTDEKGLAWIYGLAEGDYYLVETCAPANYNMLSHPKLVELNEESHNEDGGAGVPNSSQFVLPAVGGIGTVIFTVGGGLLIAAAVVILIVKKKKDDEEDEE